MTENNPAGTPQPGPAADSGDIHDGVGTYPVVILAEKALSALDAGQVHSLHDQISDQVVYHVMIPVDDAAARIEASMGTLGAGDLLAAPAMALNEVDIEAVRDECREEADTALTLSLAALRETGAQAQGCTITQPPVDALGDKVREVDAREVIILTRPHVVAEFFHVDWSSRARRKLGVPVLHLVEAETFDQQAGSGEGISGL